MTPSPSSAMNAPSARAEADPDLIALPAPPRRERTFTVAMMSLTALAALWMGALLLGEARYAVSAGQPADVGELTSLAPGGELANRYVHATALLGSTGAIRYGRAAEGDSFRLAPVAGNPRIWVEIRVPEGFEGPRYVPPTVFAGRLVPFRRAGVRHVGLMDSVRHETTTVVPEDGWILIDGSSPRSSRWAVALAGLFGLFALWNLVGVARVLTRVKDAGEDDEPAPPRLDERGRAPQDARPFMPKVTFINEARVVEVERGRSIKDIAAELGIMTCREEFAGTGLGNYTVWVKGEEGALSPPSWWEKWYWGSRGWKRMADKAHVFGDVEVWTQPAVGDRLRMPRPVAKPPQPRFDPSAKRLGVSAAGTAAFPYGNPEEVGKGERPAVARNTSKPKKAGAAAAAEADDDEESETE